MNNPLFDLNAWLAQAEWYDNHKIQTIINCRRKAYNHMVFRGGLQMGVGNGASFGSCMHAARAVYYAGKKHGRTEKQRRIDAFRRFGVEHEKRFGMHAQLDNKHTLDNGLDLLDCYFEQYILEDDVWRTIEPEIAAVTTIIPQPGDPPTFTVPFFYVTRCDGIVEKIDTGDWYVDEFKTTSGGVDREITRRAIDKQSTGYVYNVKEFAGADRVCGVLFDVMGVTSQKRDFKRELYVRNALDLWSWRRQTIHIVEEWRSMKAQAVGMTDRETLALYYQRDSECTNYGLCPFFQACYYGPEHLEDVPVNTWTPFEVE